MNRKALLAICLLVCVAIPLLAQTQKSTKKRYKIAACDWMMLKRQKIGSFELVKELGGDGVEMDMGGLGNREMFDSKLRDPHFQELFPKTATLHGIETPSVAMSGFFGQSFISHNNYKALIEDCLNTMQIMGANVAFLPLGGIQERWQVEGEAREELKKRLREAGDMAYGRGVVIGIRTALSAEDNIKLLKEIGSKGVKIYYSFQDALDNDRDICKELKMLGRKRVCQIHCTDTDGVTLPNNLRMYRQIIMT